MVAADQSGASALNIQLVIPFHQPLSASDTAMEQVLSQCYEPILQAVKHAPGTRLAVHFNGHLLDYLTRRNEAWLFELKELVAMGRVEVLGGLFYGGLVPLCSETDIRGQLQMSAEYWESYLGSAPRGFWLPELAWAPEVPRMLEESAFEYGFIGSGQVKLAGKHLGLVSLERGEQRTAAFVLDDVLSAALPARPADEWVDAAVDRHEGTQQAAGVLSVWVRAESLGLEPGTANWCLERGWLNDFFSALGGGRAEVVSILPASGFDAVRPAVPVGVDFSCAAPGALAVGSGPLQWQDFPRLVAEVDTLHRRMLHVSDKLREAIGTMEDEGTEDSWSGALATAQRNLFAAQTADAYWRGLQAGFSDPAIREATYGRLVQAAAMVDGLVQGDDDYLSVEEEDRDGDLLAEIFVSNAHMSAWLVPAQGGLVRSLDNRQRGRTVLDVATRRLEPFVDQLAPPPRPDDNTWVDFLPARGSGLRGLSDSLPNECDAEARLGLRTWVLDHRASALEFFGGSPLDLIPANIAWEVVDNSIDDSDEPAFCLGVAAAFRVPGMHERHLTLNKSMRVPIDAAQIDMTYECLLAGEPEVLVATEIPIRLATGVQQLRVDGNEMPADVQELFAAKSVELYGADGEGVLLAVTEPCDWWRLDVRTAVRDVHGVQAVEQGSVWVPLISVTSKTQVTVTVRCVAGEQP